MAQIVTELIVTNPTQAEGAITILNGETKGIKGRTVTLQATPAAGYVFEGWEIETTPALLSVFNKVGRRYTDAGSVCVSNDEAINTLYSDGTRLYTDAEGKLSAEPGFYQSYRGTYFNYDGNTIPALQTCQQAVTVSGGGGGGGGSVGGIAGFRYTEVNEYSQFDRSVGQDRGIGLDVGPAVQ